MREGYVTTARGVIQRLKDIRDANREDVKYGTVTIDLNMTTLDSGEVQKLNRRMPSIIKILNAREVDRGKRGPEYGVGLSWSYLRGIDLQGANLSRTGLDHVNFEGANFEGASLESSYLDCANFEKANLKNCNVQAALIDHTRFEGSIQEGASFEWAHPALNDPNRVRSWPRQFRKDATPYVDVAVLSKNTPKYR